MNPTVHHKTRSMNLNSPHIHPSLSLSRTSFGDRQKRQWQGLEKDDRKGTITLCYACCPMACHCAPHCAFSRSPQRDFYINNTNMVRFSTTRSKPLVFPSITRTRASYNTLVSEAVRLLGPPAKFEASKLKVVLMGDDVNKYSEIIPRTYILSHCDFTANLTLTISNVINLDQLRGWYSKDDVVAEWKKLEGQLGLHIHCYVSGPNQLLDLAAEFRYHIFSKEMPLVLESVLHGDSVLFNGHPELMEALVWVYFHSSSRKYNRLECWGSFKNAVQGRQGDQCRGLLASTKDAPHRRRRQGRPKSIFQALFAFLL